MDVFPIILFYENVHRYSNISITILKSRKI